MVLSACCWNPAAVLKSTYNTQTMQFTISDYPFIKKHDSYTGTLSVELIESYKGKGVKVLHACTRVYHYLPQNHSE